MNDNQLESLLLGARPQSEGQYSPLTKSVMSHIKQHATFAAQVRIKGKQPIRSLLMKLRRLHGIGLALAILITVAVLTGVTYASVRYLPDVINVFNKKQNSIGRIEYSAPAFADCYVQGEPKLDTFEVNPAAKLSDEDVERTLRAKCEMMGMTKFTNDTWPTYGQHKEWKDGDTIFYTRPDSMGVVESIDSHGMVLRYDNNGATKKYTAFDNKPVQAYSRGQLVGIDDIRPGDYVFSLVRASEIYYKNPAGKNEGPIERGLIAVVKMSQPSRYYNAMQQYVLEVQPCEGNKDERCSNGPHGPGVEVFPRLGEGGRNTYAYGRDEKVIWRNIGGTVSAIGPKAFTIKASSGAMYTVEVGSAVIDAYNNTDAPKYDQWAAPHPDKVRVHQGSWLNILYIQKPNEDRKHITIKNVLTITLITDIPAK
jgi:hypothetical protein